MYTDEQLQIISRAQEILQQAGLQPTDILGSKFSPEHDTLPFTCLFEYIAPHPTSYTSEEIASKENCVTRQSNICSIVDHPVGALVEFPQSGDQMDMAIGHRFQINPPNFVSPKNNIQYALGSPSSHSNVTCLLLHDKTAGEPIQCKQTKLKCRSFFM